MQSKKDSGLIVDMKADIIIDEFNRLSQNTKIQETEDLNSRKQLMARYIWYEKNGGKRL